MSVLFELAQRYPQLYLRPKTGLSQTDKYAKIARQGKPASGKPLGKHFTGSRGDKRFPRPTPAGDVEIVFLKNRGDFEHFYQIMACRCEPVPVPATMGAATISGIINWRKIEAHKKDFGAEGGGDWDFEFTIFTSDPANFKDTIILISEGPYSALPAKEAGLPAREWLKKSLTIRVYHEITHFICAKKYPNDKHAVWDEIVADGIGLLFAFERYDARLAKKFLGASEAGYGKGRLENYKDTSGLCLDERAKNVCALIDALEKKLHGLPLKSDEEKFAVIDTWQTLRKKYISRFHL